jgi:hypothetical protein
MIDQDTAIASIKARLSQTATWRRGLCERYPHDPRNAPAAAALDSLAAGGDVNAATWDAIEPHFNSQMFDAILNDCGRDVGFRTSPKSFNGLLVAVADKIDTRIGGVQ